MKKGTGKKSILWALAILSVLLLVYLYLDNGSGEQEPMKDMEMFPGERQQGEDNGISDAESFIQPADLPEETRRILNALVMENIFVFDLNWDERQSEMIRLWVEVFENGRKQDDVLLLNMGRTVGKEDDISKNLVIFTMDFNQNEETDQKTLHISASIVGETGTLKTETNVLLPDSPVGRLISSLSAKREVQLHQPVTLITMIEDDGNGIHSDPAKVAQYDKTGMVPGYFRDYDRVLLFRFMLENDPYSQ